MWLNLNNGTQLDLIGQAESALTKLKAYRKEIEPLVRQSINFEEWFTLLFLFLMINAC